MGHRTLSLELIWRALFLDTAAYDALRDDDNPFIEGAFLIALIGVVTATLSLVGEIVAWAASPSMDAISQVVLRAIQQMPWWQQLMAPNPGAVATFMQWWDAAWRIAATFFAPPSPAAAALNIVIWPLAGLLSWLIYGVLAFAFARLLGGLGTLNQTLGTTALAATPLLLHGLGVIPFLTVGSVVTTWQLICRYRALRSAQRLPVDRAIWATVLPFLVYLAFWIVVGVFAAFVISLLLSR
jgi:hypothetical protein